MPKTAEHPRKSRMLTNVDVPFTGKTQLGSGSIEMRKYAHPGLKTPRAQ